MYLPLEQEKMEKRQKIRIQSLELLTEETKYENLLKNHHLFAFIGAQ